MVIDAGRNIKSLSFGSGLVFPSAFTVGTTGGNALLLSSGGSISFIGGSTGTNTTITVNAPLVLEGASTTTAGTYTFSNAHATASNRLLIGGLVSGGTTSSNVTLTLTGANTGTNEVSGVISDGAAAGGLAISKASSGLWILSGSNTYSGGTTLTAGTLSISSAANLGGATSALTFGGGVLQVTGTTLTSISGLGRTVNFNAGLNVGLDINNAANVFTLDQNLNATSSLTKSGSGTLIVNQATNYSGLTTMSAGTLRLTSANSSAGATTLTGGTLQLNNASNGGLASGTLTTGNVAIQSLLANQAISNAVVLNGSTTISGSNSLTLNGSFTNSGGPRTLTNSVSGAAGQVLTLAGPVYLSEATGIGRLFTIAGAGNTVISGSIANFNGGVGTSGTLAITNTGTTTLTGANTYSGGTIISSGNGAVVVSSIGNVSGSSSNLGTAGVLTLGVTNANGKLIYTGAGETTDRVVNLGGFTGGGVIDQSGTGSLVFSSNFTATGTGSKVLTLQGSTIGTGEIAGAIVDNSSVFQTALTKAGTDAWTLSGTSTYTGATLVSGGTLNLTGAIGSGGGTAISVGSATLLATGVNSITGTSSLTLGTSSTVTITKANNFTGGITFGNGAANLLTLSDMNAIANASSLTITAGTVKLLSEVSGTFVTPSMSTTAVTFFVGNNGGGGTNQTLDISGTLSPLTGRTVTIAGANGYRLAIDNFNMVSGGATILPTSANVTVKNVINSGVSGIQTLVLSGSVNSGQNMITGNLSNGSTGGTTAISVAGATGSSPIWVLSGSNTYTGTTSVNVGTLLVNGTHTGGAAYTVGATGALGGTGSVSATSLTTVAGGKLTPGDGGAGNLTLSLTGGMNISASSNNSGAYLFDLGSVSASDKITLTTGTLNVGTLDFSDFTFTAIAGFGDGTYVLFDAASAIAGTIGTASGLIGSGTGTLSLDNINNDVVLTVTGVPEPQTWAMLLIGGFGLVLYARRARSLRGR